MAITQTSPFRRPTAGSPGDLGSYTNVPTMRRGQETMRVSDPLPEVGSNFQGYGRGSAVPTSPAPVGSTFGGAGRTRGKKLWEYGSRFARRAPSRFTGLRTGFGVNRGKRLGDYNLGWESPSARTGAPTIGGLGYSRRIKNPIAFDLARARAMGGSNMPGSPMPGEGPGFAPPRRIGGTSMAEARRWI